MKVMKHTQIMKIFMHIFHLIDHKNNKKSALDKRKGAPTFLIFKKLHYAYQTETKTSAL